MKTQGMIAVFASRFFDEMHDWLGSKAVGNLNANSLRGANRPAGSPLRLQIAFFPKEA